MYITTRILKTNSSVLEFCSDGNPNLIDHDLTTEFVTALKSRSTATHQKHSSFQIINSQTITPYELLITLLHYSGYEGGLKNTNHCLNANVLVDSDDPILFGCASGTEDQSGMNPSLDLVLRILGPLHQSCAARQRFRTIPSEKRVKDRTQNVQRRSNFGEVQETLKCPGCLKTN